MEKFYVHLEQVLGEVGFPDRTGSGHLMARLRRLFQRAVLDQNEMNILRGILTAVQGKRRRAGEPHAARPDEGVS
jgi:tRNA C32,U32 (ribose-2'-O)-methylase TrmJ